MMKHIITTKIFLGAFLIMLSPCFLWAQNFGNISGRITDKKTGEPLIGVTVQVSGTALGAVSDVEGAFLITHVPAGIHTLTFKFLGYQTSSVSGISVRPGKPVMVPASLGVASAEALNEVVVSSTFRTASINALYAEQKNARVISDGISADQIKKSPDKNTGDVLQRVSGASIQDHKFVVVRGLAERYNTTMMDAAAMPSTEPDKKAFSFNMIPSELISNIIIYKTASPDKPGDAAGGTIRINTKDFPDQKFVDLSIGTGFNTLTTGEEFYNGRSGSKTDFLGSDHGARRLPAAFPKVQPGYAAMSPADKSAVTHQFPNTFGAKIAGKSLPPLSLQFSFGNSKLFGNGTKFGYTGALNYRVARKVSTGDKAEYLISKEHLYAYQDRNYTSSYDAGALLNFSYTFGKTKLSLKNFFSNEFNITFISRTGKNFDGANNITDEFSQNDEATRNGLFNSVLSGQHVLGASRMILDWNLSYGTAFRDQPDQRILTLYQNDPDVPYYLKLSNENSPAIKNAGRVYSKLHENSYSGNLDFTLPFHVSGTEQRFKLGALKTYRDRNFSALALGYASYLDTLGRGATIPLTKGVTPDNLFSSDHLDQYKIILAGIAQNSKDYHGTADLNAGYLMLDNTLASHWRLVWGLRLENYDQKLISVNQPVQNYNHTDILPSVNLTWSVTDKTNIRLAYSRTINRPEFRELASFRYYDYENDFVVSGNPNLKRSLNDNADFRVGYYPGLGEILSASIFYKYFQNPIEQTNEGNSLLAYNNADNAVDYGVELEVRKRLNFTGAPAVVKNLAFFANASFIKGSVTFDGKSTDSPLQGQSPYLVNGGLSYAGSGDGFSASILYNCIGQRLNFRGENDGLDTYEKARNVLDFQIGKKVMHQSAELRLTVSDILAEPTVLYYKYDDGKTGYNAGTDKIISSFRKGTSISISFKYNFAVQH